MTIVMSACSKENPKIQEKPFEVIIPKGFPPVMYPDDNYPTKARVLLGEKLFFEKALSRDYSTSCGSCHLPEFAFSDVTALSSGFGGRLGFRNSPSILNIAYHPYFFKDGGVPTLELQVLAPLEDSAEHHLPIIEGYLRIANQPEYIKLSREAYGRDPDPYVITRAIAAYERTLFSGDSPYDRFMNGDPNAMNTSAVLGMNLFMSERLACSGCHSGFNFTNYQFLNNGLYAQFQDSGRERITGIASDIGRFKVASLRNVAITAPYMHDGSIPDLMSVIEHYDGGGFNHINQDPRIRPLNLSMDEKRAIFDFLVSLTDVKFIKP